MADEDSAAQEILLPIHYSPRSRYTIYTPAFWPLIPPLLRAGAIMGLEWSTLDFIEHAPLAVKVATFIVALLMLVVVERRQWLYFKGKWYFPISAGALVVIYGGIVAYAYYTETNKESYAQISAGPSYFITNKGESVPPQHDPADLKTIEDLRRQLAEKQQAAQVQPSTIQDTQAASLPPQIELSQEDIATKIDILDSISNGLGGTIYNVLQQGESIRNNWPENLSASKTDTVQGLRNFVSSFDMTAQNFENIRIEYPKYKDIIALLEQPHRVSMHDAAVGLIQAIVALPDPLPKDFEASLRPFSGAFRRDLDVEQSWLAHMRNAAAAERQQLSALPLK